MTFAGDKQNIGALMDCAKRPHDPRLSQAREDAEASMQGIAEIGDYLSGMAEDQRGEMMSKLQAAFEIGRNVGRNEHLPESLPRLHDAEPVLGSDLHAHMNEVWHTKHRINEVRTTWRLMIEDRVARQKRQGYNYTLAA